jgi:hypothetical protein
MMRQLSLADAAALTSAEVAGELGVTAGVGLDPADVRAAASARESCLIITWLA